VSISDLDLDRLAHLARLELTEDEKPLYRRQLVRILDCFATLQELDLKDVPPTFHPHRFESQHRLENVMRSDVVEPSLERREVDRNSPAGSVDGNMSDSGHMSCTGYIKVPRVV